MDEDKKRLKELKDGYEAARLIDDPGRFEDIESLTSADTSAFPTEINDKGELVSGLRTDIAENVEPSDESIYHEPFDEQNASPAYHELKKRIAKKFPDK